MVAITPNARDHAGLGPTASRFVNVHGLPWEPTRFPGIEAKTLFIDKATGSVTALIRMAPGARLPDHEHPLCEQSFVLEGVLEDDDGSCTAGNFVWRPAGSRHQAWSGHGCVVLGIFQVPNKFFEEGGRIADVLGQDWDAAWRQAGNLRAAGSVATRGRNDARPASLGSLPSEASKLRRKPAPGGRRLGANS